MEQPLDLASGRRVSPIPLVAARAAADKRDGIPSFLAAVEQVMPVVALMEVDNLAVHAAVLSTVTRRLEALRYHVRVHNSNSAHYGTPQIRSRIVIVASLLGPIDAPPFSVTRFSTVGDVLDPLFLRLRQPRGSGPHENQIQSIERYESLSRVRRSTDLQRHLPSRCVTSSNIVGVSGDVLRLLLDDDLTRRRLTLEEAGLLQDFTLADQASSGQRAFSAQLTCSWRSGRCSPPRHGRRVSPSICRRGARARALADKVALYAEVVH